MKVLAIETSCDETSASVVCDSSDPASRILSNIVSSQIDIHKKYGGVIPEYAARNHMDVIDGVIKCSLIEAGISLDDIDVIAATGGPGLIGGLLVGMVISKTIALRKNKPFMAINHLEGHILTCRMCHDLNFPYLHLLTSGGHFIFAEVLGVGRYRILGETLDDAAGEAFDKVAKMLGFEYPGGQSIETHSKNGDENRFRYTIPLARRVGCDASFSGIKTKTKQIIESIGDITYQDKCDIAASFQNTVVKFIIRQFGKAYEMCETNPKIIVISGGVAANSKLRSNLLEFCEERNLKFLAPFINLCSDNAAMIGWAAIERIKDGYTFSDLDTLTAPRWELSRD
jgi:N6-L-threonylcarbamoyladenine synthase